MTIVNSVVVSIALVASTALSVPASAQPAESDPGSGNVTHSAANASAVGTCDALAGRALGLVHRIDQGDTGLCSDLGALFTLFLKAECLGLLNDQLLFLTHAVGEYQLACEVFTQDCHFTVPPPACQF